MLSEALRSLSEAVRSFRGALRFVSGFLETKFAKLLEIDPFFFVYYFKSW
jgi:hypothetical protein